MFAAVVAADYFGQRFLGDLHRERVSTVVSLGGVLFVLGVAAEDLPETLLGNLSILGGLRDHGVVVLGAGTRLDEG